MNHSGRLLREGPGDVSGRVGVGLNWTAVGWGTFAGACTGFATLVGAVPVLFTKRSSEANQDATLGFAAGVMLSASYLSLIVPAATFSRDNGQGSGVSAAVVAAGVLLGAISLHWLRKWEPFKGAALGNPNAPAGAKQRTWLLIIAMTGHNLPEGAAVGVGFSAGDAKVAISTAVGIGVQNLPEGLAVAAALLSIGTRKRTAFLVGGLTGLVEPIGAFVGAALVSLVQGLLPVAMGWAAGAMLYICAAELIPSIQRDGQSTKAVSEAITTAIPTKLAESGTWLKSDHPRRPAQASWR